jgi:Outer membrane protein/protective antigen OMA87
MESIRRNPEQAIFTVKSEEAFLPYEGKIIRKIYVEQIGFDRTVQDTTKKIKTFFSKAANRLHNDTKPWVVRNNIFIKEGKPLNPYRVADNERYLRDLDFILDSRIFVLHESEDSDSVDLLIMTRDVFSLGASFSPRSTSEYRFKIQDANLAGLGQRLQYSGIFDTERNPRLGQELLYRKVNLFGSFIDGTIGYTTINNAASVGNENETAWYFRLNRPLFNPFTRWAGGMELSRNFSSNVFAREATLFAKYDYTIRDYWAGYSFGLGKSVNSTHENRNRKFIALRGYQKIFSELPTVPLRPSEKFLYEDRVSLLSQLTLFRQDFYKTKYVLGFGRTEDVAYGYRISFTGGWEKEQNRKRPYLAADLYWNHVNDNGTFYTYGAKIASYFYQG